MPEYNNPAGRILMVFQVLQSGNNSHKNRLVQALGCNDSWTDILSALTDLRKEGDSLAELVENYKENTHKHKLYLSTVKDVISSLNSFTLNLPQNVFTSSIQPSAVVGLNYIAVDLPQEPTVTPNELEQLRKSLEELRIEIESSDKLNKTLKRFLLELVRMMRDGIDRYNISGSKGLKKQFYEMVGALRLHYEEVKEAEEAVPSIWEKLKQHVEKFTKFTEFYEKFAAGINVIVRAIEHIR